MMIDTISDPSVVFGRIFHSGKKTLVTLIEGPAGCHRDRHESIEKGTIGVEGFRRIVNCPHFTDIPLILETPLDERIGNKCYQEEISLLHDLIEKS